MLPRPFAYLAIARPLARRYAGCWSDRPRPTESRRNTRGPQGAPQRAAVVMVAASL